MSNNEDADTNTENNNENNDNNFEIKLSKCIEKCKLFEIKPKNNKKNKSIKKYKKTGFFSTEKEYQDSFSNILAFSKKLTTKQKNDIDVVMFHSDNEDGLMSAYYAFKYFENKKELIFIPTKPSSSNTMLNYRLKKYDELLKNKNLLTLDL